MPATSMQEQARTQQGAAATKLAEQVQGAARAQGSNQELQEQLEASKSEGKPAPDLDELATLPANSVGGFVARVVEATGTEVELQRLLVTDEVKRPITRGESAMVIYEALQLEDTFEARPQMFKDVPISRACAIPLYRCREEGIFEGPGQTRFLPDELLRAEHVLPLLNLIETWTDTTGADTSILQEGDLFDTDPLFSAKAMGLEDLEVPLDLNALVAGQQLPTAQLDALVPPGADAEALAALAEVEPGYPFMDAEGQVSELAVRVLALAGQQTGSAAVALRAALSRLGGGEAEGGDERAFLATVRDSVLGWLEPGQRMLAEMQFKSLFDRFGDLSQRRGLSGAVQQGVAGAVLDEADRPLANQTVRVRDSAGRELRVRTDATGQFELLSGLKPGEYTLSTANGEPQALTVRMGQVARVELRTRQTEQQA